MRDLSKLPRVNQTPNNAKIGDEYILKEKCPECGGDLVCCYLVAVHCINVKFEKGGIAKDSPCKYAFMSG
jgi:hypothetical protein